MSIKKKPSPKRAKNINEKKPSVKSLLPILTTMGAVSPKVENVKSVKSKIGRRGTQYLFNGQSYGKGKLVLAVIAAYVSKFPKTKLADLQKTFPKEIQGYYEIVESLSIAKRKSEHYQRYFVGDGQPIKMIDGTVAVTSQWGSDNIIPFLDTVKKLGFTIKETK